MATQKICDHCSQLKADAKHTLVAVMIDGAVAGDQATGLQLEADLCDDCRIEGTGKMQAAIHQRLEIAIPAHKTALESRSQAGAKLVLLRAIQKKIQDRATQVATDPERAEIEQLQADADALEKTAADVLSEATKKEDLIVAW